MAIQAAKLHVLVDIDTRNAERGLHSIDQTLHRVGRTAATEARDVQQLDRSFDQAGRAADATARDLRGLDRALDSTGREAAATGREVGRFSDFLRGGLGVSVGVTALGGLVAGVHALGSAISGGISMAGDFEQNLNLIGAGSAEAKARLSEFSAQAQALGADLTLPGTSAADAAEAMLELSKAGLNVNDTLAASKGVLQLSAAGALSNAQAAEIAANALNAFGLSGDRAVAVADLLAATANSSSSEVADLAQGMSMAGAVFSSFQGPAVGAENALIDLNTAMGILANNGIKGSDAGTSLKQALLQLTGPSDKAAGMMKDLAQSVGEGGDIAFDAAGKMRSLPEIMDITARATKDMTEQQRAFHITQIFGADASRAVIALLKEGSEGWNAMRESVTNAGAAGDMAQARMQGLKGALEGIRSSGETALLNAILPFVPAMTSAAQATAAFISDVGDRIGPVMESLISGMGTAAGVISQNMVPGLGGLTAATALYAFTQLPAMITAVQTSTIVLLANAGAIAANTAAFGAIAVAGAGVAFFYSDLQAKVQDATTALLEQRSWWQAGATALDAYGTSSKDVQSAMSGTRDELQRLMDLQAAEIDQQLNSGMVASQAQLASWNARAEIIGHYAQDLQGAIAAELEAQAVSTGLIAAVDGHAQAEARRSAAMELSAEEMKDAIKLLEELQAKGTEATGQIIANDVSLLGSLESNRAGHEDRLDALVHERANARTAAERTAIDERIAAEQTGYDQSLQQQAVAYAQQQAAQLQHLGQMLINYINNPLNAIPEEQAQRMTAAIQREYGIQESLAERTFAQMKQVVSEFAASGSSDMAAFTGQLDTTRTTAVETQLAMDALAKQYTAELIHNFEAGKISAAELTVQLSKIPARVNSEIVSNAGVVAAQVSQLGSLLAGLPRGKQIQIEAAMDPMLRRRSPAPIEQVLDRIDEAAKHAKSIKLDVKGAEDLNRLLDIGGKFGGVAESLGKVATIDFESVTGPSVQGFTNALTLVVTQIQQAASSFKAEALAHANDFVDSANKMVGLLGSGVEAFTKLKDFEAPARGTLLGFSFMLRDTVADFWHRAQEVLYMLKDDHAVSFVDIADKAVDVIGKGVDAFAKLRDYEAPTREALLAFSLSLRDTVADFWHRAQEVMYVLKDDHATTFAELAGQSVEVIGSGVNAFTKLAEFAAPSRDALLSFSLNLRDVVADFWHRSQDVLYTLKDDHATSFVELAQESVGLIGTGVDAFNKLDDLQAVPQEAFDRLGVALDETIVLMTEMAARFDRDGVEAAAVFSDAVGRILNPIKTAVDAFTSLQEYEGVASQRLEALHADIHRAVYWMTEIARGSDTEGVEAAEMFAGSVGKIMQAISAGTSALDKLREFEAVPQERMEAFLRTMTSVLELMARASVQAEEYVKQAEAWRDDVVKAKDAILEGIEAISQINKIPDLPTLPDAAAAGRELGNAIAGGTEQALEIASPSRRAARIAKDYVQGLVGGIQSLYGMVSSELDTLGGIITASAQKQADDALAAWREALQKARAEGREDPAMPTLNPGRDALADMFKATGPLTTLNATIGQRMAVPVKQTLDGLNGTLKGMDDRIRELKNRKVADDFSELDRSRELNALESDRLYFLNLQGEAAAEYERIQGRILAGEKQRQDLQFLQQQLQVLDLIDQYNLDAKSVLGGTQLGLGASLEDLSTVTMRLTEGMLNTINERIFQRVGNSPPPDGTSTLGMVNPALQQPPQQVVNTTTINIPQTKYQDETTVRDQLRSLQLAGLL